MNARHRVPLLVWIVLGVAAVHACVFWLVADKHFLPRTPYLPPPTPAVNFGAATRRSGIDPRTGEVTTEQQFTVSTQLVTPPPRRAAPLAAP